MVLRASILVSLFLMTTGCGGGWHTLRVNSLSYGDLFKLTSHVIDSEGFVIKEANAHNGEIETDWSYGKVVEVGRFPIRSRVEATVDPENDGYEVSLRVRREALWKDYGVRDIRNQEGWEPHPSDKKMGFKLITRIRMFVEEFKPSDEFYNRYKRLEHMKKQLPDVLEDDA